MGALAVGMFFLGIALSITAVFCLIFTKTVKEHCGAATSLSALGISVSLSLMGYCILVKAFTSPTRNPFDYLASDVIACFGFISFFVLLMVYFAFRIKKWSFLGFVIDTLTGIIYLPALFFMYDFMYSIIDR